MHSAWLASDNIRPPVRSEGAIEVVESTGVLPSDVRRKIQRSTHALDYIEIYKRLALDSDGTAADKSACFRRAA
jgi:hypothetical protein